VLLLGVYLHWAHGTVSNKREKLTSRLAHRNQLVPLLLSDMLDRLSSVYAATTFLRVIGAWKSTLYAPRSAAKGMMVRSRQAAAKAFGEHSLVVVFSMWRDDTRSRRELHDAHQQRGLARWAHEVARGECCPAAEQGDELMEADPAR